MAPSNFYFLPEQGMLKLKTVPVRFTKEADTVLDKKVDSPVKPMSQFFSGLDYGNSFAIQAECCQPCLIKLIYNADFNMNK